MDNEYYINQIKKIGEHLINHAEDYLIDVDTTKIADITFYSRVEPTSVPTIQVTKEYIPDNIF